MSAELNTRALISVKEGRLFCFRSEDDQSRDELLISAINDVSDAVWDHCRREFAATTGTTALTADPGSGGLSLQVTSPEDFPSTGTFKVLVDDEVMLVTAGAGTTTWTVSRAQDGTTAAAHAIGSVVDQLEARTFRYAGDGWLDLSPYDLRLVSAVELYTDLDAAEQVTLTTAQYRLEPRQRTPAGTYLALVLPLPGVQETDFGFGWEVTVTGSWGMAETPGTVKLACKQWVENLVKNPGSFSSQEMAGYTVFQEQDETGRRAGMPPSVRHRLHDWRRPAPRHPRVVRFSNGGLQAPAVPHRLPLV